MRGNITVGAAEVGKHYKARGAYSNKSYTVTVERRSATHTYFKHAHGELALPNNTSIELLALKEND